MKRFALLFPIVALPCSGTPLDRASEDANAGVQVQAEFRYSSLTSDDFKDQRLPADTVLREKLLEVGNSFGWALLYEDSEEGLFIWRLVLTGFDHPPREARFTWYIKRVGNQIALDDPVSVSAATAADMEQLQLAARFFQEEFKRRWIELVGPVKFRAPSLRTHSSETYIDALQQTLQQLDLPPVKGEDVVVISARAEITRDEDVVDVVFRGTVLNVRGFDGDRLAVRELTPGSISRDDVTSLDLAIEQFTEEIGRNPDAAAVYVMRGHAWAFKGEYVKAIADHDAAVRLDPNASLAYHRRGLAWAFQGEYTRAIADFTEAFRLDPMDATVLNDRGVAWKGMRDYEHALDDFNEAVRLEPGCPLSLTNRGTVWAAIGDDELALADFNEALRLDPNDAQALFNRRGVWARRREMERSFEDLIAAIRLDPKYVSLVDPRSLGRPERRRRPLEPPETRPERPERRDSESTSNREDLERRASAKLVLARQYLEHGFEEAARRHLEQIITEYPDTQAAQEAQALLDEQ